MIFIRAQISMEYLVIIGVVLFILIPLTFLYLKYTGESSFAIATAKAETIANEITRSANDVYAYGRDSQLTIEADFPEGITEVEFLGNEVIITVVDRQGKENEIAKVADVPFLEQKYPVFAGRKKIVIKSLGNQVQVTIK